MDIFQLPNKPCLVRKFMLLIGLTVIYGSVLSQNQGNIWYFGNHCGLDFNSENPQVITDGQTYFSHCPACHAEGTATISDSDGALLLYTNGEVIWNRNHEVMENGEELLGGLSSTQSSIIIPRPGSNEIFYVFTTDDFLDSELENGLRYSVVDICRDNGLGSVSTEQKNVLLTNPVSEKLTAVRHLNGIDYWIVAHKYFSNEFISYLLTDQGISDSVITAIGSPHPVSPINYGGAIGQMKASPDGSKLAVVNGNCGLCIAEYFDFDNETGIVSNPISIEDPEDNFTYYGASFSPDNTKLYVSSSLNGNGVYQFDLTVGGGHPDSVRSSRVQITNIPPFAPNFFSLQLGPDGKIYVTHGPIIGNTKLSVIENPNSAGLDCDFTFEAIDLGNGVNYGLPNFVDSFDYSNGISHCTITSTTDYKDVDNLLVVPNPFSSSTLFSTSLNTKIETLEIVDLSGHSRQQITVNSNQYQFSGKELPKGIYLIKVTLSDNSILSKRVIVN